MNKTDKIFAYVLMLMCVVCSFLCAFCYARYSKDSKDDKSNKDKLVLAQEDWQKTLEEVSIADKSKDKQLSISLNTISDLNTKISLFEQENAILKDVEGLLQQSLDERNFVVSNGDSYITDLKTHLNAISDNIAEAQQFRANYLQKLADMMTNLHEESIVYEKRKTLNDENTENFDKALTVLNKNGLDVTYNVKPNRDVEGTIVGSDKDGLLLISLGSDDGLSAHNQLNVRRNDTYLGKIEVLTLEPNRSVCKELREYRQGDILNGDIVYTKDIE